jgi:hypothetical protein
MAVPVENLDCRARDFVLNIEAAIRVAGETKRYRFLGLDRVRINLQFRQKTVTFTHRSKLFTGHVLQTGHVAVLAAMVAASVDVQCACRGFTCRSPRPSVPR